MRKESRGGKDTESNLLCRALVSTAVLSYTLGLRHALTTLDADHISVCMLWSGCRHTGFSPRLQAIDLMTRRLIASCQRPVTVGTFFSLGHSTFVRSTCQMLQDPLVLLTWLSDLAYFHQNCHHHFRGDRRHGLRYQLQIRGIQ